jgi:hypothetical protein
MILREILQTQFSTEYKNLGYTNKNSAKTSRDRILQSIQSGGKRGVFSTVKNHPTDPHMVVKVKLSPAARDKFYDYVDLINGKAADNPFLLRVYKIETIVDEQTGYEDKIAYIEKLEELGSISIAEQDRIASTIMDFSKLSKNAYKHMLMAAPMRADKFSEKIEILLTRSKLYFNRDENKYIFNKLYLQALDLLKTDKYALLDFHPYNLMVRRGKYGLQLVINDPLA